MASLEVQGQALAQTQAHPAAAGAHGRPAGYREEELAALLRVSRAAAGALDPRAVLAAVTAASLGAAGAEFCAVDLWHPETDEAERGWSEGVPDWPPVTPPGTRVPLADWPIYRRVFGGAVPLVFGPDDEGYLTESERAVYRRGNVSSALLVPLRRPGGCLGILALFNRRPGAFSDREVRLGEELAAQAALALEYARLLADARRRADEQAALLRVGQAVVSGRELPEVLTEVARAALGVAGAECCAIDRWLPASGEFEVAAEETIPQWPGVDPPGTRVTWTMGEETMRRREPWAFLADAPFVPATQRRLYEDEGIGSVLLVPLLLGEECLGVLSLYARAGRPFGPAAARFGRDLAAQAALAMRHAEFAAEAARQAEEQAALLRVSQAATASLDLRTVLTEVVRACLGAAGAECAAVNRWHPDAGELVLLAEETSDAWPGVAEPGLRSPVKDWTLHRLALASRESLRFAVTDPRLTPFERASLLADGIAAVLLVPLLVGDDCLGLLLLYSRERAAFSDRDLRLARELGGQAALAIRNADLLADARRHGEENAALLQVGQAAISGQELPAVLAQVCRAALGVGGAECCGIDLWHPETGELEVAAEETIPDWPGVLPAGTRYPVADLPTIQRLLARREPLAYLGDAPFLADAERRSYAAEGIGGILKVPLVLGGECLGLLSLYARETRPFPPSAVRFGRDLAALAVLTIRNAQLSADTQRHLQEQAALLRVSRAATASLDLRPVMEEVVRACLGAAGAECCAVELWHPDADETEVVATDTVPDWPGLAEPGSRWPIADFAIYRTVLAGREPLVFGADDPRLTAVERHYHALEGIGHTLLVPLVVGGECLGVLNLMARRPGTFGPRQVRLGQDLAAQAALAVANARLYAETRRRADHLGLVNDVGRALADTLDVRALCALLHDQVARVMTAEAFFVGIPGEEADRFWFPYSADGAVTTGNEWQTLTAGPTAQVARTRRPLLIARADDPAKEGGVAYGDKGRSSASALYVPLLRDDRLVGVLSVQSYAPAAYDGEDLRTLETIAGQAATALRNAQLVAETRRHAEEGAALLRVSQAVISGQALDAVLAEVARACVGVAGAEAAEVELWHPETDETEIVAEACLPDWAPGVAVGARFPLAAWPTTRAVLEGRAPVCFGTDAPSVPAAERASYESCGTRSVVIVPLVIREACLGVIALYARRPLAFGDPAVRFGRDLAALVAQAIDRDRLHRALETRAVTDGLTGLLNHRAVQEALEGDLAAAAATDASLAVLLVDVDDFKLFNDTHGHLVGDRVLREVAGLLRGCARPDDRAGRYGGDEFLLVLPGRGAAGAARAADRLLARAAAVEIPVGELRLPLRLSVGVAAAPRDGRTRGELIAAADAAMYAAKDAGGGRVGGRPAPAPGPGCSAHAALVGLVLAVDRKDRYTKVHSDLVTEAAVRLGRALGLGPAELEALEIAGQLHDVGKIAVPDAILRKPGLLTEDEQAVIRQHVVFSELMVKGVPHLDLVLAAVAHHHERWDGEGYPHGKRGAAIPLLGRIMAVADAWSAMVHDRPYRKGLSPAEAAAQLRAGAGTQFDPALVEPFLAVNPGMDSGTLNAPAAAPAQATDGPGPRPVGWPVRRAGPPLPLPSVQASA